jgi:RHS repeat-associated protein
LPQSFTTYIRDSNGGQDAMARRYSASSSFAQPDPYGGSYDFGDPQSLNRYAYTKNDPVNFRDPTGTTCVEIWLTPTHYINLCNGNDNPLFDPTFMFGAGSSDGGGGGGIHEGGHGPQNPTTDCQRLADITEQFANEATSVGDFVQRMVNRFIGPNLNVDSRADLERAGNIGTREFGASGFKQQFVDTSNQVRHFTGGLWAGYYYGPGVAQLGMNSREENTITPGTGVIASVAGIFPSLSPTNDSRADVALNSVSSSLGANLTPRAEEIVDRGDRGGWRKIPANPGYKGLAAAIRNKVCE